MQGLEKAHLVYPNKELSVRVTELERDRNGSIHEELTVSLKQKQVNWLMLPMCDEKQDVVEYIDMINDISPHWLESHGSLQIICETPRCLHNLDDMLAGVPEIEGVIVGGGDYFRFLQADPGTYLPNLRWSVLNACLRHGRFPVDTPPLSLGIKDGIALQQFKSAADSGFCSGLILHPSQTKHANEIFSPSPSRVAECKELIRPWLEKRETGYKRNTGDDFIGPPHMKNYLWVARYGDEILAKKVNHLEEVDSSILQPLWDIFDSVCGRGTKKQLLLSNVDDIKLDSSSTRPLVSAVGNKASKGTFDDKPKELEVSNSNTEFLNTLMLIALASRCHPRNNDLLANLGYSSICHNDLSKSFTDASAVTSQIIGRKSTSNGNVIVTTNIQIVDKTNQTICQLNRKLMEKKLELDDHADEGIYSHVLDLDNNTEEAIDERVTAEHIQDLLNEADLLESPTEFISVSEAAHKEFCKLLNLDAPLHHLGGSSTVPSTLHLSHHNLTDIDIESMKFSNVSFQAPMKLSTPYKRSRYSIGDGKLVLSIIHDEAETILSSVILEKK